MLHWIGNHCFWTNNPPKRNYIMRIAKWLTSVHLSATLRVQQQWRFLARYQSPCDNFLKQWRFLARYQSPNDNFLVARQWSCKRQSILKTYNRTTMLLVQLNLDLLDRIIESWFTRSYNRISITQSSGIKIERTNRRAVGCYSHYASNSFLYRVIFPSFTGRVEWSGREAHSVRLTSSKKKRYASRSARVTFSKMQTWLERWNFFNSCAVWSLFFFFCFICFRRVA